MYTPKDPTIAKLLAAARRSRKPAKRKAPKRKAPKRKAPKRKVAKRKVATGAAALRARLARLYKQRKLGAASKLRAKMRKKGLRV